MQSRQPKWNLAAQMDSSSNAAQMQPKCSKNTIAAQTKLQRNQSTANLSRKKWQANLSKCNHAAKMHPDSKLKQHRKDPR